MSTLGWLGAMIIVSFFVCVPPLGWLGDMIIVFIIITERVRFFRLVLVWVCLMFYEVGFNSPTSWCLVTLLFIGEPNLKALHSPP